MKNTLLVVLGFPLLTTPLAATAQRFGDFTYATYGSAITITDYTGSGGDVTIPTSINGLPVTSIGDGAFAGCTGLTSVTIPGSVTSIGLSAFAACYGLTRVTIPGSAANIENYAFSYCSSLTNITILGGVTNIGEEAFYDCSNLRAVFFKGNAPSNGGYVFEEWTGTSYAAISAIVYYLPGTTGWGATFGAPYGVATRLWNPLMQTSGPGYGVGPAGLRFNITGTADIPIVVDACTNLANAHWVPLQSLNLTNGAFYFSDSDWTNYPARFYRIRSP